MDDLNQYPDHVSITIGVQCHDKVKVWDVDGDLVRPGDLVEWLEKTQLA